MAETDANITIGIELDDGTIKRAVLNADQLAQSLGDKIGKGVSSGVDKSLTGLAVQFQALSQIASKAFGVVEGIFGKAIEEANGADLALNQFNASLANIGKFSQAASADFQNFAASLQAVGTVSDDAVIKASTSLVSIGRLSGDALKKASKDAVDLAAGLGTDLDSAFNLVAKAAEGNTAALGRYGIKVSENIPKSERFAAVLSQIEQRFGGLDAQKANTFAGSFTQLQNSLNDVFESIGKIITNSPTLVAAVKFVSGQFAKLSEGISSFGKQGDVLKPFIQQLIDIAKTVTALVVPAIEYLGRITNTVFQAIRTGIQAAIASFADLGAGVGFILEKVGVIAPETAQKLYDFQSSSEEVFQSFLAQTGEAALGITDALTITPAVDGFLNELQRAVDTAQPITEQLKNNTKASFNDMANSLALTAAQLAKIVREAIANSISQSIQTLVTNLAKGKNAFEGLLKTIGSIFGDMLIQIGTTVLLAGIGMEAIRASIVGLTGGPAIFAGIALIAAGALLKALSGGGGDSAPTTTQAVGPGGVPGSPEIPGATTQPEIDRGRKTEVAINVQGNILDRKETGLEIATVLQEYFDTQDGVLVKG